MCMYYSTFCETSNFIHFTIMLYNILYLHVLNILIHTNNKTINIFFAICVSVDEKILHFIITLSLTPFPKSPRFILLLSLSEVPSIISPDICECNHWKGFNNPSLYIAQVARKHRYTDLNSVLVHNSQLLRHFQGSQNTRKALVIGHNYNFAVLQLILVFL